MSSEVERDFYAKRHKTSKWLNQDSNRGILTPELASLTPASNPAFELDSKGLKQSKGILATFQQPTSTTKI